MPPIRHGSANVVGSQHSDFPPDDRTEFEKEYGLRHHEPPTPDPRKDTQAGNGMRVSDVVRNIEKRIPRQ